MMESKPRVEAILKEPYTRILVPDTETGTYGAKILEFPGCVSQGDTPAEAYANLEDAAKSWLEATLGAGDTVPRPFTTGGYSGRVALRLPRSLHKQASQLAELEGTSLNQFIVAAVAEKVGATTAANIYSTVIGYTPRLGTSCVFGGNISILTFDEPFVGLAYTNIGTVPRSSGILIRDMGARWVEGP
jgi:predicted RNase H-like HicB family nuclease